MTNRVRVRRDRPTALSWALALAVTMLAVYLITLSAPRPGPVEEARGERITRELSFDAASVHLVRLGAYPDAASARIAAADLAGRGAAGVVYPVDGGFTILSAAYENSGDAERIAGRLSESEGLPGGVVSLSAEGISMMVTAPEEDFNAIVLAEDCLRTQLDQLSQMALQLDRGELRPTAARTLAAVSRSELRRAREALSEVPGAAANEVCTGLMEQLNRLAEALTDLPAESAALSGRFRCGHVEGMMGLVEYLRRLSI